MLSFAALFLSILFSTSGYTISYNGTEAATEAERDLNGIVMDENSGDGIPGAAVFIRALSRGESTGADGHFTFESIPAGSYELIIQSEGYRSRTFAIEHLSEDVIQIRLEPLLFESDEVIVTSSPLGRNVRYQPARALNRESLQQQAAPSLGEILNNSPGVAMRSFGSAPARPVIRGLDGERVLVLQNGERMGDLSSTAHDHAVSLDPLAIERVEVVRGPASLLYGSNALGGVVNLFSYDLPQDWSPGSDGSIVSHGASANRLAAGLARGQYKTEKVALSGTFAYRDAGNIRTPEGSLSNTFLNSYSFGGGFGYRAGRLETGISVSGISYDYGLPEQLDNPDEEVIILMNRLQVQSLTNVDLNGFFEHAEVRLHTNWYSHDEIEKEITPGGITAEEVELSFDQMSTSGTVTLRHRPVSLFEGAVGLSGQFRDIRVGGDEVLSPDANIQSAAAFLFEEIRLGKKVSLQAGSRLELHQMNLKENSVFTDVTDLESKSDIIYSGSAGLNVQPGSRWEIGFQVARAYRIPTLEELYSNAPHIGAGAYEIGNAGLKNETSFGSDLFAVYTGTAHDIQLSAFMNSIDHFIKYEPQGEIHEPSGLPVFEYVATEALLYGFEFEVESRFSENLRGRAALDYVIGSERGAGLTPLPYMPPLRTHWALIYERNRWWTGIRFNWVAAQNRTAPEEESTGSYHLTGLDAGYRIGNAIRIIVRLDNLMDKSYRDHLTRIEERDNPMPGRNLNISARWDF